MFKIKNPVNLWAYVPRAQSRFVQWVGHDCLKHSYYVYPLQNY